MSRADDPVSSDADDDFDVEAAQAQADQYRQQAEDGREANAQLDRDFPDHDNRGMYADPAWHDRRADEIEQQIAGAIG